MQKGIRPGIIVGTAGHVDHGKTELIKALTGVDTDRLAEEKRRGLTIDLGFAPLDLPRVGRVGIVDVPGHQKFLKNMLAGVGGIDLALLVVAADEGIMPQTREHFEIIRLLGVTNLLVVVSKVDAVDQELADLVVEEVGDLLQDTPYQGCPVLQVSAISRAGMEALIEQLDRMISVLPPREVGDLPRLLVDRIFVLQGIGTVVTGSLTHGMISQGDELIVYPQALKVRVRQIQVHNQPEQSVVAGHRVALNLASIARDELVRGDVISSAGAFQVTQRLDVRLQIVDQKLTVKDWTRVRLYLGSAEILARLVLLEKKQAQGGEQVYAQLRLERPAVAWYGDRFVVRLYSPQDLMGGGVILNPVPAKHRRFDPHVLESLKARDRGDLDEILRHDLSSGPVGLESLRSSLSLAGGKLDSAAKHLETQGQLKILGRFLVGMDQLVKMKEDISIRLAAYHRRHPLKAGMSKEELKGRIRAPGPLLEEILAGMEGIEITGDVVKQRGREIRFTPEQQRQRELIESAFLEGKLKPPTKDELLAAHDSKVFYALVKQGVLVALSDQVYLHSSALQEAKEQIGEQLGRRGEMTLSEMKDVWGTTRKFAVPLAEHLDRIGFTQRTGDKRSLVRK